MVAERQTLARDPVAPSSAAVGSWDLHVQERQQQRVLRLPDSGVVTLGRGAGSDLHMNDDSVSRQHARIYLPSLEIEDLGSRNGTWVLDAADHASLSSVSDKSACEELRLGRHVRCHFEPGAFLKLGGVTCQVQRGARSVHTLPVPPPSAEELPISEDPETIQLYALAERVAGTDLPLLILGETGVGKDVLAARVHQLSRRRTGPFVRVNCGALSDSLLESELFGHVRGAFTGAHEAKAGLFELGNGGTLFLDEIGELPLRTQVKLLHVLETGQVTRVGSTKPQRIDVRFVSATNRELARDVAAGSFRKDLFFRINTLCLKIAPLRERRGDILPLVRQFLRRASHNMRVPEPPISPQVEQHLEEYGWPGNVRELKNAVECARLLCGSGPLLPEHFPTARGLLNPAPDMTDIWTDESPTAVRQRLPLQSGPAAAMPAEHTTVAEALSACGGNQTRAAEMLGISRRTLVNRLNELKLPRPRKGRS
jgi:DNA-binding NtrC family response regulator